MSDTTHTRAQGILMLTLPDGKVINMRVKNVELIINEEHDEDRVMNVNGSVAVYMSNVTTYFNADGFVEGMTIIESPNPG